MDVTLRSISRNIVIETKFTQNPLQEYMGKRTFRSDHLYQLFAYLRNSAKRKGAAQEYEGILLYAAVDELIDAQFEVQGYPIRVVTLDLSEEWPQIRAQLLRLLQPIGLVQVEAVAL